MRHERKYKLKSVDGIRYNSDGSVDLDLDSVGDTNDSGWLLCSETPDDLGIPEGYEIDPESTMLVSLTFHFGIREKKQDAT